MADAIECPVPYSKIYIWFVYGWCIYHISAQLQREREAEAEAKQSTKRCAGNMLTKIAHKMRRDFGDFVRRDNGHSTRDGK